jgi:hypothetical protein
MSNNRHRCSDPLPLNANSRRKFCAKCRKERRREYDTKYHWKVRANATAQGKRVSGRQTASRAKEKTGPCHNATLANSTASQSASTK